MKRYMIALTFICIAAMAVAQNDRLQDKIEAQRVAFITEQLQLTPEEAQQFWPLYNEYRDKEIALNKEKIPARGMALMSDQEASDHLDKILDIEQQVLAMKIDYTHQLKSVLSPRKILKLYAAERQFKERLLRIMNQRKNAGNRN